MPDGNSVQNMAVTSDDRVRDVLRRHIQRAYDKRQFSRESLARESGVNKYSIDAIVSRDAGKQRRVAAEDAFNLAYTLGEEAVIALVGCIHYSATRHNPDAIALGMLMAQLLPYLATIAKAVADGRIDHVEWPDTRSAADHIIQILTPLSSAGHQP